MIINFRNKTIKRSLAYILSISIIFTVFYFINYIGTEGFNPSDDGVVLAQSYRIINGEIAHKDFISIRPIFSGVLHSIHFLLPFPLFNSARWFVVLQFIVIAFTVSSILPRLYQASYSIFSEISTFFILFTLSILNYNLYPWTTIDAIFWSSIALWCYYYSKNLSVRSFLTILFLVLAALSRQTFALPALIVSVLYLHRYFWNFNLFKGIVVIVLAWLPAILYFIYLVFNDALPNFITQLTGRTEFFEAGIRQFAVRLIKSYAFILHSFILIIFIITFLFRSKIKPLIDFIAKYKGKVVLILLCWALANIIIYFSESSIDIYSMPFELFYISIDLFLIAWLVKKPDYSILEFVFFLLLIAYVSSISLGDNSPIFACGLLGAVIFSLVRWLLADYLLRLPIIKFGSFFLVLSAIVISVLGVMSQRKINYRDLSANELHYNLNKINKNFGSVVTNNNIGEYYAELVDIFKNLPQSQNRTIVLPNNAAFYPILETRNPLPLDWMQAAEYVGSEKTINESVYNICKQPGYYFIVDKIDVKLLNEKLVNLNFEDYYYISIIKDNCNLIRESKFFLVFLSQ